MATPTPESTAAAPVAAPVQINSAPPATSTNSGMTGARVPQSSEGQAPRERAIFREENPTNVTLGDDKGSRNVEPTLPKFGEAARKMMKDKAEAEANAPEEKKQELKPKKEVVSADDATPTKPNADDTVPEDHLKVLPHDKPDTARRIKALLAERDAARQEATAAKSEYEKAKAAPSTPPEELSKLREEATKAAQEAARYRRMVEVEKDPEIISKYDEPSKQAEVVIESTLKQYGLGESTLKAIQIEGGFAAFSRSQKTFDVQVPDPDYEGQTKTVKKTASQLAHEWLNAMGVADAEAIKSTLGKQQLLQSEKAAAKAKMTEEATQYYENQTKAQRDAQEAAKAGQEKATKEYSDWAKQVEAETDFLKDKEVPATATPAQKSEVEKYNARRAELRAELQKHPTTPLEYGQMKLRAAESVHLRDSLESKDAEIEALKEQLKRARGATRTTPKSGSILTGGNRPVETTAPSDPTDLKSALRQGLKKFTGGDE